MTPTFQTAAANRAALAAPGVIIARESTANQTASAAVINRGLRRVKILVTANNSFDVPGPGNTFYLLSCVNASSQTIATAVLETDQGSAVLLDEFNTAFNFESAYSRLRIINVENSILTIDALVGFGTARKDGNVTTIKSNGVPLFTTFVRPNNVTPYAANQVVTQNGPPLNFSDNGLVSLRTTGGRVIVTRARVMKNSTNLVNASFRLFLHNPQNDPGPIADQVAFPLLFADAGNIQPFIDFPVFETAGAGSTASVCDVDGIAVPCFIPAGSNNLTGRLVSMAAYVPTANENFRIDLFVDQI